MISRKRNNILTKPEPPEAIKRDKENGQEGHFAIWEAIWETRIDFSTKWSGLDVQVKMLGALMLLILGAIAGLYFR